MASADGLRILFYHRVADDPGDPLAVTCERFEAQMALLERRGCHVLDVVEALDRLYAGELEPNTIAITFDDGYLDNADTALPVLERHGFRATVFVVTDLLSGKGRFQQGHGSPAPLLSWDEIRRLDGRSALTFEAHTVTHPNLVEVSDAECWAEIEVGRRTLEGVLGRPSLAFCYPGGFLGAREHEYVRRAGFRYAITTEPGLNTRESDPYLVRRTQMSRTDRLADFEAKLDGSHDVPLAGRRLYRRVKYGTPDPVEQVRRASLSEPPPKGPPELPPAGAPLGAPVDPAGGDAGEPSASLAAGSAWLLVTQGIANAGFLLTVLLLARGLSPAERGTAAFLTLSMLVLGRIGMLGIPEATAVRIARDRSGRSTLMANLVISASVVGAALGLIGAAVLVATGAHPAGIEDRDLIVVCAILPVATVVYATVVLMVASGRTLPGAILNMLHPWVYAVALAILVGFSQLDARRAAMAWGVGMYVSLPLAIYTLHRVYGFGRPRFAPYVAALRFGIWACLSEALKFLNFRLDQLLMGFITTSAVLGTYAVAVNGSEILLYLPSATAAALLPVVARARVEDQQHRTLRTFRILMVFTIPGTVLAMALGPLLLPLLFGEAYEDSVSAFLLLAPGALGYTALTVFSSAALGSRMPVRSSLGAATAFIVGVCTLLILVPRYGANGAALSATLAFLAGGIVQVLAHRSRERFPLTDLVPRLGDVQDTLAAARRVTSAYRRLGRRVT